MNNPNITWFDNIRWKELAIYLSMLIGILTALESAPISGEAKEWIRYLVSVLSTLLAFLRNPKKLEWVGPNRGEKPKGVDN